MADYRVCAKPKSAITPVDAAPVEQPDGSTWQTFKTEFGKVFLKVVQANGITHWYRYREKTT